MKRICLDRNWTVFEPSIGTFSATVPGCVHTDLLKNGLIEDPFWRDQNQKCQWIEERDWGYRCSFDAELGENVSLCFDGLDTYATITLNGVLLGKTENMFIPHRFSVTKLLKETDNRLEVRFTSPVRAVEGQELLDGSFTRERLRSRRIQCTYGWDWVDRFVTCGIYRPVYLQYSDGLELESLYVYTVNVDTFGAQIAAELFFENCELGKSVSLTVTDPLGNRVAQTSFWADQPQTVRHFDIANPMLWYPNGYGAQPLYRMSVTVGEETTEQTFGIRTLKIVELPDAEGSLYHQKAEAAQKTALGKIYGHNESFSGFFVVVNGVRIFCKGGNWVPCEPFPSAETDEKICCLVERAADMGANFLRVWGGGLFEKKAFYDACDRKGILVAQDFLMACGQYPEKEAWFVKELQKEATFAAKYLRNHPCLAWWHGDNENALKGSDTQTDYKGRNSALEGLAPQIYKYDHTRRFLPSTPYGGNTYASATRGTSHTTNYVGQMLAYFRNTDCHDYKEFLEQFTARFISEETSFGAVCRSSMLRFMTEEDLTGDPDEQMLLYHTKGNPALPRPLFYDIRDFARKIFGDFLNGEDRFFKYKYLQYEWVRVAFENAKRNLGYCNGLIFWMHNDCWPAALGWSFVDYYCLPKASYYAFRRCARPILSSVIDHNGYEVTVSNDFPKSVPFSARVYRLCLQDGKTVTDVYTHSGVVPAGETVTFSLPWRAETDCVTVCDLDTEFGKDRSYHKAGLPILQAANDSIRVLERGESHIVLQADRYLHAVELEGEYLFDDNYFSMLAGETRKVSFQPLENRQESTLDLRAYTLESSDT